MIALIRRPWLRIDKTQPPFVRRVEVGAYGIDDTSLPFDLRTFKISYKSILSSFEIKAGKSRKIAKEY